MSMVNVLLIKIYFRLEKLTSPHLGFLNFSSSRFYCCMDDLNWAFWGHADAQIDKLEFAIETRMHEAALIE